MYRDRDCDEVSALLAGCSEPLDLHRELFLFGSLFSALRITSSTVWSPHPTNIWKWGEDWISISPRQKRKSVFSLHPSWNSAQSLGHCIESYCPPLTLHCHCKGRCPSFKLGAAFFQRALHCGRRPCLWPRARCPRARGERNGAGDLPIMANP